MGEKVKFGVFGTFRGLEYIRTILINNKAEVTAILDKDPLRIEQATAELGPDVKVCRDFDDLLASDIDAVILCNYFNEHAPYAIRALRAGKHVLSETQTAVTLKQCVELVEAVEESGKFYALAENYPFFRANQEMRRVYQSGQLGEVAFAEGEYIHPMSRAENEFYNPGPKHWRSLTPCTYYCTHALAPLMYITDLMPKKVIGKVSRCWAYTDDLGGTVGDNYGIELVEMSNGAVFRVGGCGAFGPKGNWYRLGCSRGGIESVRGSDNDVRISVNPWQLTDENRQFGTAAVYTPELTEEGKKAAHFEHSGADYWVTRNFVEDILANREPYMNVYRSAALAAVGILGWISAVNGSKELEIPDFSKKEDRDKYRDNDLTPYAVDGKEPTLPNALYKTHP